MPDRRPGTGALEQLVLAMLLVTLAVVLTTTGWLWRLDKTLFDAQLKLWSRPASSDIVVVAIDETSLSALGRWPWSRGVHAKLLDRINEDQPRVIALDLIFAEPDVNDPAGDRALRRAMEQNGRTVLPVLAEQARLGGQLIEQLPITPLAQAAAALGHVHVELDRDGIARSVFLRAGLGSAHWPALGLAMLEASGMAPETALPGERNPDGPRSAPQVWVRDHHALIPFAGPPGHFARISYVQVLRGEYLAGTFKDKFVFVGVTATGLGDAIPTPVSGLGQSMPGVELNANLLDALRLGIAIKPLGLPWRLTLSTALVLLPMLLYPRLAPRWSLAAAGLLLLATLVLTVVLLVGLHRWFPPSAVLLVVVLSYPLWSWRRLEAAIRYLDKELERLRVEQQSVPALEAPAGDRMLSFLSSVLPARRWLVQSRDGGDRFASAWTGGVPPREIPADRWSRSGEHWWTSVVVDDRVWLVGMDWQGETPPDHRHRRLLLDLVRTRVPEPRVPRSGKVELIEARIQQVQAATARLQTMRRIIDASLDQMTDGVLVVSNLGQVLLANQQAARYLCREHQDELFAVSLLELLARVELVDGVRWDESLRQVLVDGVVIQLDARNHAGRDLLVQLAPFDADEHRVGGLVMNLSDITVLKDSQRRRAEVLGFLSHDLRSPLVSILALVELARNKQSVEELSALLARTERYTAKTLELAEQFLELARAESPERIRTRDVDLLSVAMNAFDQVWVQAQSKHINLSKHLGVEEAWVVGDPELLERAIVNLLTNAIKYSPQRSEVRLELARNDTEFYCAVVDQGMGIAEADLPKLFSRFERVGAAQQQVERGTGLGLAFVKAVAERHGGRVEVTSSEGRGSRFRLVVPAEHELHRES